jgi:hypothetical protein
MIYERHNPNVCFLWPAIAIGLDVDGMLFFEAAWLWWAIGLGSKGEQA